MMVSLPFVNTGTANAWSGYLPQCANFPDTWQSAIEADSRFTASTSWAAFKRDWYSVPFDGYPGLVVVWNQSSSIYFDGNGVDDSGNGLAIPSVASFYKVTTSGLVDVSSSLGGGWGAITFFDVNCIQDTHNVQYRGWVGYHYSDAVKNNQGLVEYVGMGDSYSSGEGNTPFEPGTDQNGVNGCHRSSLAYPSLLRNSPELDLGATAFVACSGATTASVTDSGQWNEPSQADALTSSVKVITLTIGGNDVGFPEYAQGCSVACGPSGPGAMLYNAMMNGINQPAFKDNLVYTYEKVLNEAPNADLYVADYPYLVSSSTTACWGFDFSGAYAIQTALNNVIQDAVGEVSANNTRIHFVEVNYSGSPFENGLLCGGTSSSLFYGPIAPPDTEYSFHPNVAGQAAYAEVFREAIG